MKRALLQIMLSLSVCVFAEVTEIDGRKFVCKDGVCMLVPDGTEEKNNAESHRPASPANPPRIAQGYMNPEEFTAFIENRETGKSPLEGKAWWIVMLLVLLGGISLNLTPCVLPMIPINLMIIGRSASRGALYGLGIALAYGTLGIIAAAGGMAFGEIQSNPYFNAAIAAVFLILSLAMLGVIFIDFSKKRDNAVNLRENMWPGAFAFFMGAVSAILAGACVAPILISVLLLTADLTAKGGKAALCLPFILGLGMALPWPFAGAGLKVLPKPGAWMTKVNKVFGITVLGFAVWYGHLAWKGFSRDSQGGQEIHATRKESFLEFRSPAEFSIEGIKRPILVDCWATWCKNCSAMDKTTLSDRRVKEALKKGNFTTVKLQAEDITALKKLPGFEGIMGLPAFLIFE